MSKANDRDERADHIHSLPLGYRDGFITAIAIFLSLSIAFLRFWSFDAPGTWTLAAMGATAVTLAGIALQLYALFRALDVRDEMLSRYRVTVRIFFAGIVIAMLGAAASSTVLAIEGP